MTGKMTTQSDSPWSLLCIGAARSLLPASFSRFLESIWLNFIILFPYCSFFFNLQTILPRGKKTWLGQAMIFDSIVGVDPSSFLFPLFYIFPFFLLLFFFFSLFFPFLCFLCPCIELAHFGPIFSTKEYTFLHILIMPSSIPQHYGFSGFKCSKVFP